MTSLLSPRPPVVFGPYRLDIDEARLMRGDRTVALRPKAFDLLVALVGRPNELVTKDELLDRVWGRRFITEGVIKSIVGELRDALEDDARQPRWIETVPKHGYRFIGAVRPDGAAPSPTPDGDAGATRAEGNVPQALPAPIGRAADLATLGRLHDAHRLLTIAGPSGVGKTRVALALAAERRDRWPDGVWFVELASLASGTIDVRALCALLAQLLRLDGAAGRDVAALARALRPIRSLIVIDNAEHLLEPVAALVDALLAGTTSLRLVVTSQEPLAVAEEQVYRLAPLALPDADADRRDVLDSSAVQLFLQRVSSRVAGFAMTAQQQQAVVSICRTLDGMPLALELAAARVPLLGVHGIADLLVGDGHDARLQVLTVGARTAAPRQRTLRNAIAWSYGLLDDRQQRIFQRLAVFHGGFSLRGAQVVCGDDRLDDWSVLDAVHALADKSLLESSEVGGETRFRLLDSLRTFALEQLETVGDDHATRDRHLRYVLLHWSEADGRSLSEPALAWTERERPGIDDLRAALRRADANGDGAGLVALVVASSLLWCRAALASEGRAWCERARPHVAAPAGDALAPRFALAVATLALYGNAYPASEALPGVARAADAFTASGDATRAYFALYLVFQLHVRAQVAFDRRALLERMQAVEGPGWSVVLTRFLRSTRSYELRIAGDAAAYLEACRTELALCRSVGAVAEGWIAAQGLMLAEHDLGHVDRALTVGREAIAGIRRAGRLRQHAVFLALWTTMLAESGAVEPTRDALADTLAALRSAGSVWMAHVALAWLAAHEDRDDDAARMLGRHRAALQDGSAVGAGAYVARAMKALDGRLAERLGVDAFDRLQHAGRALDDETAVARALGARA